MDWNFAEIQNTLQLTVVWYAINQTKLLYLIDCHTSFSRILTQAHIGAIRRNTNKRNCMELLQCKLFGQEWGFLPFEIFLTVISVPYSRLKRRQLWTLGTIIFFIRETAFLLRKLAKVHYNTIKIFEKPEFVISHIFLNIKQNYSRIHLIWHGIMWQSS